MRLYIVRHGKANDALGVTAPGVGGHNADFGRELTLRGEAQAKFLAARLVALSRPPTAIVASRFPRALQTAHTIQQTIRVNLVTDVRLEVDHEVSEAIDIIQEHARRSPPTDTLMLVGHNPQLGELIGVLCSGLPPMELILKTGELVGIDVRPAGLIGSGKIVERLRMSDEAEDSVAGAVDVLGVRR